MNSVGSFIDVATKWARGKSKSDNGAGTGNAPLAWGLRALGVWVQLCVARPSVVVSPAILCIVGECSFIGWTNKHNMMTNTWGRHQCLPDLVRGHRGRASMFMFSLWLNGYKIWSFSEIKSFLFFLKALLAKKPQTGSHSWRPVSKFFWQIHDNLHYIIDCCLKNVQLVIDLLVSIRSPDVSLLKFPDLGSKV